MAVDTTISGATGTPAGTVNLPGGAGGQPLKVPTTAAGRALMGAADAAAQRAALGLGSAATASASAFDAAGAATAAVVLHVADGNPHGQYARTAAANTFTATQTVEGGGSSTTVAVGQVTVADAGGQSADLRPAMLTVSDGTVATKIGAGESSFGTRGTDTLVRIAGLNGAWEWSLSTGTTVANGVDDHVMAWASNFNAATGLVQDKTQPSVQTFQENRYKAAGKSYTQSEQYFQVVLPTDGSIQGKAVRPLMCETRHDGSGIQNTLRGDLAVVRYSDDRPNWTLDSQTGVLATDYARIDFGTNYTPVVRQRKAAGGDNWVSLVYLDATDTTQVGEGGPVATGWTLTSAAGFDLQYDYAVRVKSIDGKSATEAVRLRNDTGRLTFGQSGQSMDVAGRAYFTHTPSFASDAVVTVAPAFTGKSTGYYAAALTPTIAGDNSGSNHATLWLGPTVTAGTYTGGSHFPAFARTTFNGATVPDGWGGFRSQAVAVGGATVGEYAHYDVQPAYIDGGSTLAPQVGVRVEGLRATDWAVRTGDGLHRIGSASAKFAAFGGTPVARPVLSYDRSDAGETAAVAAIRTALAALGWVDDQTIA